MSDDEIAFVVPTDRGEVKATIATTTLRTFAGRSHVTTGELLSNCRQELEDVVRRKTARSPANPVRLEAKDLI